MSSILKVDQLQDSGGNNLVTSNGSGVITSSAFGKVLQVVSTTKTDTFSTSSTTDVTITGLTVNITPSSTNSKILIMASINVAESGSGGDFKINLYRDSTQIFLGDTAGNRNRVFTDVQTGQTTSVTNRSPIFLDTPSSSSQITYSIKGSVHAGTVTGFINRGSSDTDSSDQDRSASSITVMEISA
jgi:hypothetical protein